ncbi:copper homeostasis protein CutC [Raineyella sp. W15-4]|uniref:copper homeostasis protein CutC n=1 Tax=Raineyella sp. W15-4 TaxID=3081651 RepID=UPI0029545AC6|nr:copper homeostasis protein CutC [Raineyella sp. W15-4]WOQ16924.1 copper homeostasis protein CutC [Raineyella sp. W15-4]
MTLVEICADDPGGEVQAEQGGAGRVELCAVAASGGVTPSIGTVEQALEHTGLPIQVLVRPRPGDFVHDRYEVDLMCRDIAWLRRLADGHPGRLGVTTGVVTPDRRVDRAGLARLVDAAGGLPVTFHRAFDDCPDLPAALADLVAAKIRRVLTAGGPGRAHDHVPELRALVSAAGHDLEILAGGGVRSDHVAQLVAATGVSQVHLRAQAPSSRGYARTSADLVAELVGALRGMPVKH